MTRRGRAWSLITASVCWLCAACCAPLTMTAANSINPVMFGPARTLGSGTATGMSRPVSGSTTFRHEETTATYVLFGFRFNNTTTNPAGDDESGFDWRANLGGTDAQIPARLDWKVFRATGEDPDRRVELTSIWCLGLSDFSLLGISVSSGNWCRLEGVVPAAE